MTQCVACGGSLQFHRKYEFKSASFREVYLDNAVYRCVDCRLSQVDMSKVNSERLSRYYTSEYRVVASAGALSDVSIGLWGQRAKALAGLAMRHAPARVSRIFEVGAGYGLNLMELHRLWPEASLRTDEVSEVASQDSAIAKGDLADGPHDLIVMSHVLEHFEDPKGLLGKTGGALSDGGIVVIEVPNDIDDIQRYNGPDEPHLTFFEQPTLRCLLERVRGLQLVEMFNAGPTVRRTGLKTSLRSAVRSLAYSLPIVSGILKRRAPTMAAAADFATRNPDGWFIRAVLKRK